MAECSSLYYAHPGIEDYHCDLRVFVYIYSLRFSTSKAVSTDGYVTRTNRFNLTKKIDKPHNIKDGRTVAVENEKLYDMLGRANEGNFIKDET